MRKLGSDRKEVDEVLRPGERGSGKIMVRN
jgi:hypothetical protein